MKARQKRRSRHLIAVSDEQQTLNRIAEQLDRLQTPVAPDVLDGINIKLGRIESRMESIGDDAARRGAMAGAITGGLTAVIVSTAIMFIRAKLEL